MTGTQGEAYEQASGEPTLAERVSMLEGQVAGLLGQSTSAVGINRPDMVRPLGLCDTCWAKMQRGETAVCGCITSGPIVT